MTVPARAAGGYRRTVPLLFDYAPPWVWVLACAALATFYAVRWPHHKAENLTSGLRRFVLRWFHCLVWVALGACIALYAWGGEQLTWLARALAWCALPLYAVFALVLLGSRHSPGE